MSGGHVSNCHCAVCLGGYSRQASMSPTATRSAAMHVPSGLMASPGQPSPSQPSRLTLNSECLSADASRQRFSEGIGVGGGARGSPGERPGGGTGGPGGGAGGPGAGAGGPGDPYGRRGSVGFDGRGAPADGYDRRGSVTGGPGDFSRRGSTATGGPGDSFGRRGSVGSRGPGDAGGRRGSMGARSDDFGRRASEGSAAAGDVYGHLESIQSERRRALGDGYYPSSSSGYRTSGATTDPSAGSSFVRRRPPFRYGATTTPDRLYPFFSDELPIDAAVGRRSAIAEKYLYSGADGEGDMMEDLPPDVEMPITDELPRDEQDMDEGDGQLVPYLPQPGDDIVVSESKPMEPVGPWAQGKADWGPLAGLTGTRPVVDKHSITRYSLPEWRKNNADTFTLAAGDNHLAGMVDFNGRACIQHVSAEADKNQMENTKRMEQRAMDVHRWRTEVEKAHKALWEEMQVLDTVRRRIRRLLGALTICANVSGQCLDIRAKRFEPDLVRDDPEEQLVKEVALIAEIRGLMKRSLKQVEEQLNMNRAAKKRLESDFSDKDDAYHIDTYASGLRNGAPTALFREGATRFPDNQSTPENWEARTRENVCLSENERAKSVMLRNLIDCMIHDSNRDLHRQKCLVEDAVQKRIEVVANLLQELENNLALILRRIIETERLIDDLKRQLRKMDATLKVAQTRLHSRLDRPRNENCRDGPQYGLVDEVKSLSEQCSALLGQIKQAEDALQNLISTRRRLEIDIVHKKKQLYLDRDRIQNIRQRFPNTAALTGHQ